MSFFAAGGGLAVIAGLGLRIIESRCEMEGTQDAAPSSAEPAYETKTYADGTAATGIAPLPDLSPTQQDAVAGDVGNAAGGVSGAAQSPEVTSAVNAEGSSAEGDAGNADAGTAPGGAATPAIAYPSASQPSAEVAPLGEVGANPSSQQLADSGASISAGDVGERHAEEPEDSGTLSPSSSIAAPAAGADAGNEAGQADSASTAISTDDAPLSPVTALAVATFADLMDQFETRQYPDGSTLKTVGALPESSPVSYPAPQAPEADTPHGLLNAIEAYFTTALRSSRTDGHKLIAQLRAQLPSQQ